MITSKTLHVSESHFKLEEDGRFSVSSGDIYISFSTLSFDSEIGLSFDGRLFAVFCPNHVLKILDFYNDCLYQIERHKNQQLKQA